MSLKRLVFNAISLYILPTASGYNSRPSLGNGKYYGRIEWGPQLLHRALSFPPEFFLPDSQLKHPHHGSESGSQSSPSGLLSQRARCPGAMIKGEVNSTMAHVVTLPTAEPMTTHNEHHGLPPFAAPMLILFGVFVFWLLIAGIVLYILA